jgi:hypothetical protein
MTPDAPRDGLPALAAATGWGLGGSFSRRRTYEPEAVSGSGALNHSSSPIGMVYPVALALGVVGRDAPGPKSCPEERIYCSHVVTNGVDRKAVSSAGEGPCCLRFWKLASENDAATTFGDFLA